jgi:hypothetical protein
VSYLVLHCFQLEFWSNNQPTLPIKPFFLFQLSGFACFIFSLLVTCICIGLTNVMERSDFYQHYYIQLAENQSKPVDDRPLGERIITVVKETFNIYLNFGLSVWNYILITFINFTATLCVFPAICQLGSSYEYKNCKLTIFNKDSSSYEYKNCKLTIFNKGNAIFHPKCKRLRKGKCH